MYFYLKKDKIEFTKNKLPIEWKINENLGKTKVIIATNIKEKGFNLPTPFKIYDVGLLKSSLQKAVRRNETEKAMYLAWQLLCQDTKQFLRRFPIIVMEDAILHPNYPMLVWIMIAYHQSWKLTEFQVEFLLKIVYEVASCQYRDKYYYYKNDIDIDVEEMNEYLVSLYLRINKEGMKGDMEMLKSQIMIWNDRFNKNQNKWMEFIHSAYKIDVDFKLIKELMSKRPFLQEKHYILEAIYFHCYPVLINKCYDLIKKDHSEITQDDIKKSVWFHKSGINLKKFIVKDNYNEIEIYQEEDKGIKETQKSWDVIERYWNDIVDYSYWSPK